MSKPRSLSLAAYRVLSWGMRNSVGQHTDLPRPEGELLWVHVATPGRLRAVNDFCHRMLQVRSDLNFVLTTPPDVDLDSWPQHDFPLVNLPQDQSGAVRGFLDHWRPSMGLWVGGDLMPNILTRADEHNIPLVLFDAQFSVTLPRSARWLPDITRATFDCFQHVMTASPETARQIRRLGIPSAKVHESPPLRISPNPRPWPEDELIETNHTLAGRPVWLAAWVQDKEFISVLTAHRQALRMLHRLVLVLHVADELEVGPLKRRLETMDLRCVNWDAGEEIEDTTQVILTSDPENLGLWCRVSAVTFMASSLERGAGGRDPSESIALGSAIIYGPFVHRHDALYSQLRQAGAAKQVKTATELGDALIELLAPDLAAGMALAGWQMITEGAPQADALIEMVQDILDQRSAEHAGA
ncbi:MULTISPECIES: 3-deoxy-D-manno-octulosonic acid transferase [unclassified Ruegeria]|uniref:3-deoxy-D-manno-octulosonic acid transferase n=1 Tax=unclassified Ruegeria TaxID=2625375 RepID=UPI001489C512|nr:MULTISPECIES: glycosyltransferase N-terminal domain-containing protein [unclassified Ruegeria]NOD65148.1 3-deoxy-D-manno-octulosonic acid transferase [Ruegeria sp. HKCCD6109]